jgi:Asp/Glu/hydantoin racemase
VAARSAVRIPVVGAASATYHLVYQLGGKYAVISVNEKINPTFLRAIKLADCTDRMTSMRSLKRPFKVPMDSLPYTPEELEEEIAEIAARQIEQEGAQVIVVAFTLLNLFVKPGALERLSSRLNAVFVDPQAIGFKTAEMLARLKLSHSEREYPLL